MKRTALWISCYVVLALGPLVALLLTEDLPPTRGFWIEFSAALGFISLAMMALQFVLTARFRGIASPHGIDTIIQFHREAGLVAVTFALVHPVLMIWSEPSNIAFLDPQVNFPRAAMLALLTAALPLIVVLTFERQRFGIPYEWWRLTHGFVAAFIVSAALAHILRVEWYVVATWQRRVWIGLTVAALLLLGHVRLGKPLAMRSRPYRVVAVRPEGGRTWTLELESAGHQGTKFEPGQFAWLTLGPTPFSLQQHPFSFSSSAVAGNRIEFAIRELGDFTARIGDVRAGTMAFLEGPYGAFVPNPKGTRDLILIAGGVGVAPMMSILRTFRDRGDPRSILLIYGNRSWEDTAFRQELQVVASEPNRGVVFLASKPEPGSPCDTGRIQPDVLDRYLPKDRRSADYLVCGPPAMMDAVERYLLQAGVPPQQVQSERFDIA